MPKVSKEPIFIGCELIVRKGDSILLGLRKNSYGAGTWALPGGHLEFGEGLAEAVCREANEELGADIAPTDLQLVSVVDDARPHDKMHQVHISFELSEPDWEPQLMEPEYCEAWRFFQLTALPDDFFPPHKGILENYLKKRLY